MLHLRVNGKAMDVEGVQNLSELLAHFRLEGKIVVIEHNGEIIDRTCYDSTLLADGDTIEIVHFVGGG